MSVEGILLATVIVGRRDFFWDCFWEFLKKIPSKREMQKRMQSEMFFRAELVADEDEQHAVHLQRPS